METSAKNNFCITELFEQATLNYIDKLENTSAPENENKKLTSREQRKREDDKNRTVNLAKIRKKNSLLINVDNKEDNGCCK